MAYDNVKAKRWWCWWEMRNNDDDGGKLDINRFGSTSLSSRSNLANYVWNVLQLCCKNHLLWILLIRYYRCWTQTDKNEKRWRTNLKTKRQRTIFETPQLLCWIFRSWYLTSFFLWFFSWCLLGPVQLCMLKKTKS